MRGELATDFARARGVARSGGEYAHEGCGFASFAADLTAHRQNLDAVDNDLASIRSRLTRIAEAEGWEMPHEINGEPK